jgi:hypothetical protein
MCQGDRTTDILGKKELLNGKDLWVMGVQTCLQGGVDGLEFVREGERWPGRDHTPIEGHRLSLPFGNDPEPGVLRARINTDDYCGRCHQLHLSHHLIGDVEVGIHILHVIVLLQLIHQFKELAGLLPSSRTVVWGAG